MDMRRPARIPPRVNGDKPHPSVRVRYLISAQEFFTNGIEPLIHDIGINATRVALPDIHDSTGEWRASILVHGGNADFQRERQTLFHRPIGRIGTDIATTQPFVDKIGTFSLLGSNDA